MKKVIMFDKIYSVENKIFHQANTIVKWRDQLLFIITLELSIIDQIYMYNFSSCFTRKPLNE